MVAGHTYEKLPDVAGEASHASDDRLTADGVVLPEGNVAKSAPSMRAAFKNIINPDVSLHALLPLFVEHNNAVNETMGFGGFFLRVQDLPSGTGFSTM